MWCNSLFATGDSRTFDPDEADYFMVMPYTTCLIFPVFAWADGPWWPGPIRKCGEVLGCFARCPSSIQHGEGFHRDCMYRKFRTVLSLGTTVIGAD